MRRLLALALSLLSVPALAEDRPQPCPALVAHRPALIRPAALGPEEVRLTFVGHATFLIETPAGARIATDYNDYVRPAVVPHIATMNRAHSTHYSLFPDPAIAHVLRGWDPGGGRAVHDLTFRDVRVRNVPTNIRSFEGGTQHDGNSIFVFEAADLCIAHLGHLHHPLEPAHLKALGRIDVVLVPVDGSYTLDLEGMMQVLADLNAPLVVPMHYFGQTTLNRFLARARERYEVVTSERPDIVLSRATLPSRPRAVVLPGR
jgi:L-ascorbate metabolism protein UlaG (beta-lactamase superfamily)